MTLVEFGDYLKTQFPGRDHVPSEAIALQFLKEYPQYRDFVGASTDQIQQLISKKLGFLERQTSELTAQAWKYRADTAASIQSVELNHEASMRGVDVETMLRMKLMTHQATEQIRVMRQQAAIELKTQMRAAFYKLKLAGREVNLRRQLAREQMLEERELQDGEEQSGQVRGRLVPEGERQEVG